MESPAESFLSTKPFISSFWFISSVITTTAVKTGILSKDGAVFDGFSSIVYSRKFKLSLLQKIKIFLIAFIYQKFQGYRIITSCSLSAHFDFILIKENGGQKTPLGSSLILWH